MYIKKGDNVIIVSGKDKGKKGKVLEAFPRENKIIVENVNIKKKHQKPRKSNQKGQIVEFAVPLDASNAMLIDPKLDKPTRISFEVRDNKKVRLAKKSGSVL